MSLQITHALQSAVDNVAHHKLVIIQWLYCGDRDGGQDLAEQLAEDKIAEGVVQYFACRTKREFESILRDVIDSTTSQKIPLLHLLTHAGKRCQGQFLTD